MMPLKLEPAFKDYLWGGTKLRDIYGKKCDFDKVAESWELSCHKDGNSVIANGPCKGMTLAEYIEKEGKGVLGKNCERFENFPVLIKLIDAKDDLSVQVHPNDEYALRVEGEYGKTEMWYIVDCDEGAEIIYGFKRPLSKGKFEEYIKTDTLLDATLSVRVKKGDVFFIEAGTLHAIGKGILIAEIQQNSNTTYRVYDYGRVGADGKTRPLHIEKALDVTNRYPARRYYPQPTENKNGCKKRPLAECEYFTVYKLDIEESAGFTADDTSFHCILLLEGEVSLICGENELKIKKGETVFIPANCGVYTIHGSCEAILTMIDDGKQKYFWQEIRLT